MQKINRPLKPFPIDILLLSIDNRQRVTCNIFKFNQLQNKKINFIALSIQNAQNGVFANLSIQNGQKGHLRLSTEPPSRVLGTGCPTGIPP